MAKLSQQLTTRPTRTQRVAERQEGIRSQEEFKDLTKRAESIRESEFSNIQSVEEYEQKYNTLDPTIKQFFQTPTNLREGQTQAIGSSLTKVQGRISFSESELRRKQIQHDKQIAIYQDQARKYPSRAEYYKKREQAQEDKWEEEQAYWSGYQEGLNEGLGKLRENQNLNYSDILSYSQEIGGFERSKQIARNKNLQDDRQRQEEIEQLEKRGVTPILIKKFDKGQLQSEHVSFLDPTTKTFSQVTIPLATKTRSIGGLQKSKIPFTPVSRDLQIGSKDYSFVTKETLYLTPQGKLTTQLGGTTTKTEAEIIKAYQTKTYEDFLIEYPKVEKEAVKEQQLDWWGKTKDDLKHVADPTLWLLKKAGEGISYVGKRTHFTIKPPQRATVTHPFPQVDSRVGLVFGKKGEDQIYLDEIMDPVEQSLREKSLGIKELEISKQLGVSYEEFKGEKEKQAEKDVTSLFYRSEIGKEVFFDQDVTDKEVQESFKSYQETGEYKDYSTQYAKDYQKELDTMLQDVSYGKKIKGSYSGLKMVGLNLASFGVDVVSSPEKLVVAGGVVYGGTAVLGGMTAGEGLALTVAYGSYGGYKLLSKKSTIEERGSGLLLVGIAGTSLGIQGLKYARSPTVKYAKIKPPKIKLKTHPVGHDIKLITDKGVINKVIFKTQKLSQVSTAGRRTIVSTKLRNLLKLDPIYKGVPYNVRNVAKATSLRATYRVPLSQSGYQKAYKLLVKRGGYTPYQAKTTLRYVQPKIIEQYLAKGTISIKGSLAKGEFIHITKQPVITIDKGLGIKTKGARTIKTITDIERKLVSFKKGTIALEHQTKNAFFLKRGSSPFDLKSVSHSRGINLGKASDLKKGFDLTGSTNRYQILKEIQYKNLKTISLMKKIYPRDPIIQVSARRTQLIKKIIDLTKHKYILPKNLNVQRTPFSKTFGSPEKLSLKNTIKDLSRGSSVSGGTTKDVKSIMKEIKGIGGRTQSQYYGTGQYERSESMTSLLKQAVNPPAINLKTQISNLIGVKVKTASITGIASLSALTSISATKQDQNLKSLLRSDLKVNTDVLTKINTDVFTKDFTKSGTAQKSALKQVEALLTSPTFSPSFSSPVFDTPVIRTPTIKTPVIPFYFPNVRKARKRSKNITKQIQDLAYLPDFTSRAIGLKAETITQAQARKKLKKILTGLEVRRPVKIKL